MGAKCCKTDKDEERIRRQFLQQSATSTAILDRYATLSRTGTALSGSSRPQSRTSGHSPYPSSSSPQQIRRTQSSVFTPQEFGSSLGSNRASQEYEFRASNSSFYPLGISEIKSEDREKGFSDILGEEKGGSLKERKRKFSSGFFESSGELSSGGGSRSESTSGAVTSGAGFSGELFRREREEEGREERKENQEERGSLDFVGASALERAFWSLERDSTAAAPAPVTPPPRLKRKRLGSNASSIASGSVAGGGSKRLSYSGIFAEEGEELKEPPKPVARKKGSKAMTMGKGEGGAGDVSVFVREMSDVAVKVGTRARLLVEVDPKLGGSGEEILKITWFRNDQKITIPPDVPTSRIHQTSEGRFHYLDISPVITDDEGKWVCTAENFRGRSSCACQVKVMVPKSYRAPEFVEGLRAVLTEAGTVSLECKVIGTPTPLLKWYKDGVEIKAGDIFALRGDPSSLGVYTCEATNCMGSVTSSSRVHMNDPSSPHPPHIQVTHPLQDSRVRVGERLDLQLALSKSLDESYQVTWYNKSNLIGKSDRVIQRTEGNVCSLYLNPVEIQDDGEWVCEISLEKEKEKVVCSCTLSILVPRNYRRPKFLEDLKAILTEEGLVSFECKVCGFPTPILHWYKDGYELKPGDVYQLSGANSLGRYSCIAHNCMGDAESSTELTLEDIQHQLSDDERKQLIAEGLGSKRPPKFITGLKSLEGKIGDSCELFIEVNDPNATIQWVRDGTVIEVDSSKDNGKYTEKKDRECYTLLIRELEFDDQAEWKCTASNEYGHSASSAGVKLIIPGGYKRPKFLESLRAVLSEEGTVNLECKVIGVPVPILKWYKDGVELKAGDIHRITSGADGTCCLGTYNCVAKNCMGEVSSSAALLGFEDKLEKEQQQQAQQQAQRQQNLTRDPSLSTIMEERTSQMLSVYDTPPHLPRSIEEEDLNGKDVSVSIDGKDVSVSLYETPDLTENDAKAIIEMFANEYSEYISEHNVIPLPSLRFVKETSTSGNIVMEAVIIDVTDDPFDTAKSASMGGVLREDPTEADYNDDEFSDSYESPMELSATSDVPEHGGRGSRPGSLREKRKHSESLSRRSSEKKRRGGGAAGGGGAGTAAAATVSETSSRGGRDVTPQELEMFGEQSGASLYLSAESDGERRASVKSEIEAMSERLEALEEFERLMGQKIMTGEVLEGFEVQDPMQFSNVETMREGVGRPTEVGARRVLEADPSLGLAGQDSPIIFKNLESLGSRSLRETVIDDEYIVPGEGIQEFTAVPYSNVGEVPADERESFWNADEVNVFGGERFIGIEMAEMVLEGADTFSEVDSLTIAAEKMESGSFGGVAESHVQAPEEVVAPPRKKKLERKEGNETVELEGMKMEEQAAKGTQGKEGMEKDGDAVIKKKIGQEVLKREQVEELRGMKVEEVGLAKSAEAQITGKAHEDRDQAQLSQPEEAPLSTVGKDGVDSRRQSSSQADKGKLMEDVDECQKEVKTALTAKQEEQQREAAKTAEEKEVLSKSKPFEEKPDSGPKPDDTKQIPEKPARKKAAKDDKQTEKEQAKLETTDGKLDQQKLSSGTDADVKKTQQSEEKAMEEAKEKTKKDPQLKEEIEAKVKDEKKASEEAKSNTEEGTEGKANKDTKKKAEAEEDAKAIAKMDAKLEAEKMAREEAEYQAKLEKQNENEAKNEADEDAKAIAKMDAILAADEEAKEKEAKKTKDEAEKNTKLKAEKEAEEKREKEAKEKAEKDAKLKAEKDAKEKAEKDAKLKAETETDAKQKVEREEKEKAEKDSKLKAEKEANKKAEKEAKEKAEKEAKEKTERESKEKAEKEAKEKAEKQAKEKAEKEAKEKAEKDAKLKAEKAEKEAKEKADQDAKLKAEKDAKEKAEKEAKEKAEKDSKLKAEKEEKEKAEKEAKEKAEKQSKQKAEKEAKEKAEKDSKLKAEREAKEKAEKEAKEKAENEAKEKAEKQSKEDAEKEAKEAEKLAKEKAEKEAKEKAEKEAKEKAEKEAKEKAEKEAKDKAEKEAKEKAEKVAKEKAEKEAKEKAEKEAKEKAEKVAKEKAEKEAKEKAEKEAKEKAEKDAKEKAEKEAKEKAENEAKLKSEEEARKNNEKKATEETDTEADDKNDKEAKEKVEKDAKLKAEKDAKERAEKEAKEKADKEAKLKAEKDAKDKAEKEAKEKADKEAKLKAEKDAKEKAEKEAKEKADKEAKLKAEKDTKDKAEKEAKEKADKEAKLKAEKDAKDKAEKEAKEKADKEAKLKAEKDAKDKAEKEAKEKADKEAKLKAEKDAKDKAEKEAKEKADKEAKLKAEKDAKDKAEKEAKEKTDKEAKLKAEKDAREKAEKEAKEKTDKDAKLKAEKDAKDKAEKEAKLKNEKDAKEKVDQQATEKPGKQEEKLIEQKGEDSKDKLKSSMDESTPDKTKLADTPGKSTEEASGKPDSKRPSLDESFKITKGVGVKKVNKIELQSLKYEGDNATPEKGKESTPASPTEAKSDSTSPVEKVAPSRKASQVEDTMKSVDETKEKRDSQKKSKPTGKDEPSSPKQKEAPQDQLPTAKKEEVVPEKRKSVSAEKSPPEVSKEATPETKGTKQETKDTGKKDVKLEKASSQEGEGKEADVRRKKSSENSTTESVDEKKKSSVKDKKPKDDGKRASQKKEAAPASPPPKPATAAQEEDTGKQAKPEAKSEGISAELPASQAAKADDTQASPKKKVDKSSPKAEEETILERRKIGKEEERPAEISDEPATTTTAARKKSAAAAEKREDSHKLEPVKVGVDSGESSRRGEEKKDVSLSRDYSSKPKVYEDTEEYRPSRKLDTGSGAAAARDHSVPTRRTYDTSPEVSYSRQHVADTKTYDRSSASAGVTVSRSTPTRTLDSHRSPVRPPSTYYERSTPTREDIDTSYKYSKRSHDLQPYRLTERAKSYDHLPGYFYGQDTFSGESRGVVTCGGYLGGGRGRRALTPGVASSQDLIRTRDTSPFTKSLRSMEDLSLMDQTHQFSRELRQQQVRAMTRKWRSGWNQSELGDSSLGALEELPSEMANGGPAPPPRLKRRNNYQVKISSEAEDAYGTVGKGDGGGLYSMPSYFTTPSVGYSYFSMASLSPAASSAISGSFLALDEAHRMKRPRFSMKLQNRTTPENTNVVKFAATVFGTPPPTIQWYKNGLPIFSDQQKYIITSNCGVATLDIHNVDRNDTGEYTCFARNFYGKAASTAILEVVGMDESRGSLGGKGFVSADTGSVALSVDKCVPVCFTTGIIETTFPEVNELVLEAQIKGSPRPDVMWMKNGQTMITYGQTTYGRFRADFASIFETGKCRLIIQRPRESDSGVYTCVGRNYDHSAVGRKLCWTDEVTKCVNVKGGGQTSPKAGLYSSALPANTNSFEYQAPRFIHELEPFKRIRIGEDIALTVEITGVPQPEVRWFHHKNTIYPIKSTQHTKIISEAPGVHTLYIPQSDPFDLGTYTVRVMNKYGMVESSCSVSELIPGINDSPTLSGLRAGKKIVDLTNVPPCFAKEPREFVVLRYGDELVVECEVEGWPQVSVNLYRGCRNVTLQPRAYKELNPPVPSSHANTRQQVKFTLTGMSCTDFGMYTVEAKNIVGVAKAFVNVKPLDGGPFAPTSRSTRSMTPGMYPGGVSPASSIASSGGRPFSSSSTYYLPGSLTKLDYTLPYSSHHHHARSISSRSLFNHHKHSSLSSFYRSTGSTLNLKKLSYSSHLLAKEY